MASTGRQSPEALDDETRWRSAGDRIQTLLDASAGSGTVVRERTEQLAAELTDLYGAALERIVSITAESAPELVGQFAADELVASLMLVHGLHPHGVERRIEDALDSVRPYLGSHGGDVTLLEVVDGQDGPVVRLQFAGSCKSCPSSAVTLEFAVEDAVRAAAPEITSIEVVAAEPDSTSIVWPHLGGFVDEPRPHQGHQGKRRRRLAPGCPTSRISDRARSADSWSRACRSWRAESATICSPTTTGAVGATTRWRAPRCTARWARPSARRSSVVRAATHISTWCTPAQAWTTLPRPRHISTRSRYSVATVSCRSRCSPRRPG